LVCVAESQEIERWTALGIQPNRIHVTGSIKYDPDVQTQNAPVVASPWDALSDETTERLVLFGGSTHRGEEEILARVFLQLRQQFPALRLFIAPRHVERLREIRAQLGAFPLRVALASEMLTADGAADADCLLLDTTGDLQRWYGIATVVFVGKSLTAHGGQNPVEPILAGKPVVLGPHMENFATLATTLVSTNGAMQVSDAHSLERTVAELLRNTEARQRLVRNAQTTLSKHQGATACTAALVHKLRSEQELACPP
jgi:3-deoxy-D-manno-octulosonic-acid transferase